MIKRELAKVCVYAGCAGLAVLLHDGRKDGFRCCPTLLPHCMNACPNMPLCRLNVVMRISLRPLA